MQRDNMRGRDSAVVRMVEGVEPMVVKERKVVEGRVVCGSGNCERKIKKESYERKIVKVGEKETVREREITVKKEEEAKERGLRCYMVPPLFYLSLSLSIFFF